MTDIKIVPVHPHIGAEIRGVDLTKPLRDTEFKVILEAFNQHSVLVFRNQNISDAQQIEFSQKFGELEETSFTVAADNPYIYSLSNVDENDVVLPVDSSKRTFLEVNARWHTDSSFRKIPAMASILSGRKVPKTERGDTAFASMRVGWNTLPGPRRTALKGGIGVHSYGYTLSLFEDSGVPASELDAVPPVEHPLVRTHPGSGERSLYVSGHIEQIVGMPRAEGQALARELIDWCTRPDYVYKHRWQTHDLVMWDNRCALHRATNIPAREPRIMHRTTVAGTGPVA